jgi:NO-binding membrane sensor protein with MHYT domain
MEYSSAWLLLQSNISGLGLNSHFIQMLAIKSKNTLAGAPLLGNSLNIQSSTMFN